MSTSYSLPQHATPHSSNGYSMEDTYSQEGAASGIGWDGQSDGGGKFRLKRRRRCGQCGPCQVKENCNKCQYCMRKDVLKQACVFRKCIYLRKPVSRFRQEPTQPAGATSHKTTPLTPPHKPTSTPVHPAPTNSANSNSSNITSNGTNSSNVTPAPSQTTSSSSASDLVPSQNSELSSCRLNRSPLASHSTMNSLNNGALDPLRHRMIEQPHSSGFEHVSHHSNLDHSRATIDVSKSDTVRFSSRPILPGLNTHCRLDTGGAGISYANEINPAGMPMPSSLNTLSSALSTSQNYQPPKGASMPSRDQYFPSMEAAWSSVPYALPCAPTWATSALPTHHHAASYGFQQPPATFPPSFTPSCRLGLPDSSTAQFTSSTGSQHSFHHSMASFSQDFTQAASSRAASLRGPVNPPFYHTPSHIPPSNISSFHGLGQFPAGQATFAPTAYSMHPHTHMYPSSFYSFRATTEPQIYHTEIYPSQNPFKHALSLIPFNFSKEKGVLDKDKSSYLDFFKDIGLEVSEKLYLDLNCSKIYSDNLDIFSIQKHSYSLEKFDEICSEKETVPNSFNSGKICCELKANDCLMYKEKLIGLTSGSCKDVTMLPAECNNQVINSQAGIAKNLTCSLVESSKIIVVSPTKSSKNLTVSAAENSENAISSVESSKNLTVSSAESGKNLTVFSAESSNNVIIPHSECNKEII